MSQTKLTSQAKLLKDSFAEMMKSVYTSTPGYVLAFDPATQLAQVQIGIMRVDINGSEFVPPPIIEVPVYFPGGQFCVEYQIDAGTEGDILFSQRCVDGWLQTGGVAANPLGRFHDAQDAFFLPGFRSIPNAIKSFQNDGIRLRNAAGTQYAWLKGDGSIDVRNGAGFITVGANGTVTINGVTIDPQGNVVTPTTVKAATVTGTTDVVFGTTSGKNHVHTGVTTGPNNTGKPV